MRMKHISKSSCSKLRTSATVNVSKVKKAPPKDSSEPPLLQGSERAISSPGDGIASAGGGRYDPNFHHAQPTATVKYLTG